MAPSSNGNPSGTHDDNHEVNPDFIDPDTGQPFDLSTQKGRYAKARFTRREKAARRAKRRADQALEREIEEVRRRAADTRPRCKAKTRFGVQQVIESNPMAFMQPYLDALGIRVFFVPDPADPAILHPTAVIDPDSLGTVLYGVSKDGHVVISRHKDIEAQQRAAERLFDRVYGKPKQTNVIAGAQNADDPQLVPFDDKRQAEVAAILEAAQRPSHGLPDITDAPTPPDNSQN